MYTSKQRPHYFSELLRRPTIIDTEKLLHLCVSKHYITNGIILQKYLYTSGMISVALNKIWVDLKVTQGYKNLSYKQLKQLTFQITP